VKENHLRISVFLFLAAIYWLLPFGFVSAAANPALVKDIYPGSTGSSLNYMVNMNNVLYFSATEGVNGAELWKSDGTAEGTAMLKNIYAGSTASSIANMTVWGSYIYFSATEGTNGKELWKSDGTADGTALFKDMRVGSSDGVTLTGLFLTLMDGNIYFGANNGTNGTELWKSDGTAEGTAMLKDIRLGSSSGMAVSYMRAMGSNIYFSADEGTNGTELWKSDGTADGTALLKNINSAGASLPQFMNVLGSNLYFGATDDVNGKELWKSDGTAEGTAMLVNINPSGDSSPSYMTPMGSNIYFSANNGTNGTELWKSDGTAEGTAMVVEINPSGQGAPNNLLAVGDYIYFSAYDGVNGVELWKSDGTAEGTAMVVDLNPGSGSASPSSLNLIGDYIYFSATDGTTGTELWCLDTTAPVTSNTAPATTAITPSFATDGTGLVTVTTTVSDADANDVTLYVDYSLDGGTTWASSTIGTANSTTTLTTATGAITGIGTASANAITFTWNSQTDGATTASQAQLRVTPNDGTVNGTAVTSSNFTIDNVSPDTPSSDVAAGSYRSSQSISLASTGSSQIRYTTDNSTPTCSVGTVYSSAISITSNQTPATIKAVACDSYSNASSVATLAYTITRTSSVSSASYMTNNKGQAPVTNAVAPAPSSLKILKTNLGLGYISPNVKLLQKCLNAKGFTVAKTGPGSPGQETSKFGALTRAAIIKYQKANKISPAVGFFGPLTSASLKCPQ